MKAARYIECLESYRGIAESPDGSNRTPIGVEFGWNGVAWCAQSQSLALCGAKWNGHGFDYAGGFWDGQRLLIPGVGTGDYRKGWANVQSMVAAFRRAGRAGTEPRYPCPMAWQWSRDPQDSHVGAAIRAGSVITLEGNHRNRFEQWSRDPHAQVLAYLFPPWDDSPSPAPVPLEDDDMKNLFLFTHKGGEYIGAFGQWCRPIPTQQLWEFYKGMVPVFDYKGKPEIADDVFNQMTLLPVAG